MTEFYRLMFQHPQEATLMIVLIWFSAWSISEVIVPLLGYCFSFLLDLYEEHKSRQRRARWAKEAAEQDEEKLRGVN